MSTCPTRDTLYHILLLNTIFSMFCLLPVQNHRMTTAEINVSMSAHLDLDRPMPEAVRAPSSKPQGGARILTFVLQTLVMAIALSLFFLFAGVAAVILSHLFVAGRTLRYRRTLSSNPNPRPGPSFFNQEDLKKLPLFDYSTTTSASDCAICLENFRAGDKCRSLVLCGHEFHRDCVDRWLVRSVACPICRRGVLAV